MHIPDVWGIFSLSLSMTVSFGPLTIDLLVVPWPYFIVKNGNFSIAIGQNSLFCDFCCCVSCSNLPTTPDVWRLHYNSLTFLLMLGSPEIHKKILLLPKLLLKVLMYITVPMYPKQHFLWPKNIFFFFYKVEPINLHQVS